QRRRAVGEGRVELAAHPRRDHVALPVGAELGEEPGRVRVLAHARDVDQHAAVAAGEERRELDLRAALAPAHLAGGGDGDLAEVAGGDVGTVQRVALEVVPGDVVHGLHPVLRVGTNARGAAQVEHHLVGGRLDAPGIEQPVEGGGG